MRKKVSKVLAMTLVAALMVTATPVSATVEPIDPEGTEGTAVVTITGQTQNDFIEVTLPGDIAFNFNPDLLSLDNEVNNRPAAAIMGEDYNILNRGNNPVRVIIKPYIEDGKSGEIKLTSADWPKINPSGTDYETDLKLASGTNKVTDKVVRVAAILADTKDKLEDGNEDGIYEFAYAGTSGTLGREQYDYVDGVVKYDSVKVLRSGRKNELGSGAVGVITLGSGTKDSVKNLTSGSQVFNVVLKPNSAAEDSATPSADSVSSFTFVGLANQHAQYNEETDNLTISIVFDVMGLSRHELENNAIFKSGTGQGAILWSGSAYGY